MAMAKLKILTVPHPLLRQKSWPVAKINGSVSQLANQMLEFIKKGEGGGRVGVGLSAPQIGQLVRLILVWSAGSGKFLTMINPEIIWNSDKTNFYREFCLSNGPIWGDIERPASITMRWTDINGEQQEKTVDDFLARCWQHECDHLDGIVCLDKAVLGTIGFATSSPLAEKLRDKPINFFPVDKP